MENGELFGEIGRKPRGFRRTSAETRTRRIAYRRSYKATHPEIIKAQKERRKARKKADAAARYLANREAILARTNAYKKARRAEQNRRERIAREEIIDALGGKCAECGFADRRALQVDHVRGNGAEHRRKENHNRYWRKILADLDSGDYQVLCANCNWMKGAIQQTAEKD